MFTTGSIAFDYVIRPSRCLWQLAHRTLFNRCLNFLYSVLIALSIFLSPSKSADLQNYLPPLQVTAVFPGADDVGAPVGEPPIAPVRKGGELLGYVYLNSDFTSSIGYSGKPIRILVGIDTKGVIRGIKLVDHKEPIVLIGIPEAKGCRSAQFPCEQRSGCSFSRPGEAATSGDRQWCDRHSAGDGGQYRPLRGGAHSQRAIGKHAGV